jgi:hypothetical protein
MKFVAIGVTEHNLQQLVLHGEQLGFDMVSHCIGAGAEGFEHINKVIATAHAVICSLEGPNHDHTTILHTVVQAMQQHKVKRLLVFTDQPHSILLNGQLLDWTIVRRPAVAGNVTNLKQHAKQLIHELTSNQHLFKEITLESAQPANS